MNEMYYNHLAKLEHKQIKITKKGKFTINLTKKLRSEMLQYVEIKNF